MNKASEIKELLLEKFGMEVEGATDLGEAALESPQKYNGFMGISIQHMFFSKKNMEYYFQWASNYFKDFVVVLMDDPDRHNFTVFKGIDSVDALVHSRRISDELKQGYERRLVAMGIKNIKILTFRDFSDSEEYRNILKTIQMYSDNSTEFSKRLMEMMDKSIGGKIGDYALENNLTNEEVLSVKLRLLEYLVEELSSIVYFTETGYPIEVDPTIEFLPKQLIYDGAFAGIVSELKLSRRGHINIHPQGVYKRKILKVEDSRVNGVVP